ncbi:MAG TPA: choline dehydrogenase, partial [Gammaproteobacteria bacterium]|nr:choline dehydrogenase [Gammaproteobacteria bacterium]
MAEDIVDVLIIGAGASSAAAAWSLSDTKMRILCLEQGDWMNPAGYPSTNKHWQVMLNPDYNQSPNVRRNEADYPINEDESAISVANFNGVGGGTILYSGHFPRLKPSDFKTQTLDGVGDDWPVDYYALEPFFAQNDRNMGVSGLAGDPAIPYHEPPLPPVPIGRMGEVMGKGLNKLGWHWWPS